MPCFKHVKHLNGMHPFSCKMWLFSARDSVFWRFCDICACTGSALILGLQISPSDAVFACLGGCHNAHAQFRPISASGLKSDVVLEFSAPHLFPHGLSHIRRATQFSATFVTIMYAHVHSALILFQSPTCHKMDLANPIAYNTRTFWLKQGLRTI